MDVDPLSVLVASGFSRTLLTLRTDQDFDWYGREADDEHEDGERREKHAASIERDILVERPGVPGTERRSA